MDDTRNLMSRMTALRRDYVDFLRQNQAAIEEGWGLLEQGQAAGG